MKIQSNRQRFLSCHVAGFSHYEGCQVINQMQIGQEVKLVREDKNDHDHDAIAIFYGETHIGYVPSSQNEQLAQFIDLGYADIFEAHIQQLAPNEYPEQQVQIIIYLKRNA